jgi:hypothetical protein
VGLAQQLMPSGGSDHRDRNKRRIGNAEPGSEEGLVSKKTWARGKGTRPRPTAHLSRHCGGTHTHTGHWSTPQSPSFSGTGVAVLSLPAKHPVARRVSRAFPCRWAALAGVFVQQQRGVWAEGDARGRRRRRVDRERGDGAGAGDTLLQVKKKGACVVPLLGSFNSRSPSVILRGFLVLGFSASSDSRCRLLQAFGILGVRNKLSSKCVSHVLIAASHCRIPRVLNCFDLGNFY